MKDLPLYALASLSLSLPLRAEILECRRVIEVAGQEYVYRLAPPVKTRIPTLRIDTQKKEITFSRLHMDGRLRGRRVPYSKIPPNEEFETHSLQFMTDVGETILNSSQRSLGRFFGQSREFLIVELYEGDVDASAWSYLCPLNLMAELELEEDLLP
jgi:hypothetical protein